MSNNWADARSAFGGQFPRPFPGSPTPRPTARLKPLGTVKHNPGNLRGLYHVPAHITEPAPLVVVLHGCTQTAADYDLGSGWSRLADRHGFALLFPEQKSANNASLCFNWFQVGDSRRGKGEPNSIHAMIEAMRAAHPIDGQRIFVTGLSAGGAMTSVMLATYPETFAAGAVIAGLPYGCASDVREAFDCMGGRASAVAEELAAKVRRASPHKGPWPRVSVWQGSADLTVVPSNADALVMQWARLHGLPAEPSKTGSVEGYPYRAWLDEEGRVAVERYEITGMAHGTPLMPGIGEGQSGEARAHMLDARISSTDRIAAFFGIAPEPAQRHGHSTRQGKEADLPPLNALDMFPGTALSLSISQTIEDALKAAGLSK